MTTCKYGHAGNMRMSVPKHNGKSYPECRTCDRDTKRFTRAVTRHLLRIGDHIAALRRTT